MTFAYTMVEVAKVYEGSDGAATTKLFARLYPLGPAGDLAVNLFRAHKSSARAKVYRGGGYRGKAYDKKQWAMDNLCTQLAVLSAIAGIERWGWGIDDKQAYHKHVLYIDLPTGQVSFHTAYRGSGPDYPGQWDGQKDVGGQRVVRWIATLLDPPPSAPAVTDEASA